MIEIKNLSKSFGDKKILKDISLRLEDSEIVAIVGPSGGGKTTLLRCISGLETMDHGEIFIDQKQVDPTKHQNGENLIGVVFQDFNLFPHLTVIENLLLAPTMVLKKEKEQLTKEAIDLLTALSLEGKEAQYPFELSGGQKQRVAIARALLMEPKVLCYDEPTSALDPDLRDSVAETILNLKKEGVTQIIVTHDHEFARKIADQLIEVEPIK
ncbi:amino acid ABC transporter ATP-binding protein [Vagococcus entomophilus]|uniref:Polar amino acid ABC transporter ATP-binding protein n=1 Tax=Vagococcus entomophilus TaxID=1160095 RepID=A0A430AEN4_9ENTE|nr:amino acid ABC transporter ATP-binding protein [Vagococcus entomophilus]RSU05891.1 polar amino acid ABC transporter ATP-binding protein [Vagococcus entomophilus]